MHGPTKRAATMLKTAIDVPLSTTFHEKPRSTVGTLRTVRQRHVAHLVLPQVSTVQKRLPAYCANGGFTGPVQSDVRIGFGFRQKLRAASRTDECNRVKLNH